MFFDDHPEFLKTSRTASSRSRLNLRHQALIEEHRDVLQGRTVVDIASHDGRWSFAALEAGAARVVGIEGRGRLVRQARRTLREKGVEEDRFRFVRGDVHERIFGDDIRGDVVFCFGFLYHTARYVELMAGIRSTGAEYVIVDTRVLPDEERPIVEYRTEHTATEALAIRDRFALDRKVISGVPSEAAVVLMLDAAGYEVDQRTDWAALLVGHEGARGSATYADRVRVSFRARRRPDVQPA